MNRYGISNSKIFITGGAGFIGTQIAAILAEENEIILYDNLHNNAYENTSLKNHTNVKLVNGDVLDLEALKKAMDKDVEYVIHCAAIAGVGTVIVDPMRTLRVNILGVFNVFEAAQALAKLKRIIDFSTSEVFGQFAYKVKEHEANPQISINEGRWTYAISKLTGEFIAHAHHVQNGLPTVTVRPFNIYGPNQVGIGAIHNFILQAIRHETLYVHNDGTQIRSWCYIDDFVHGLLLALSNPKAIGKVYNIGSPESTVTVINLAEKIRDIAGSRSKIENKKIHYEDVNIRVPDIDAIRSDLHYEPQVRLHEGLTRTINWYAKKNHESKISAPM